MPQIQFIGQIDDPAPDQITFDYPHILKMLQGLEKAKVVVRAKHAISVEKGLLKIIVNTYEKRVWLMLGPDSVGYWPLDTFEFAVKGDDIYPCRDAVIKFNIIPELITKK
jgi:hypothetical protein